ncbi:MAG: hypothetical protein PWP76_492 [Candidatus Diapherotrites archaeon]|nr:hypothetical protein [Candidatus Diapherotrites archaeon]MDN5367022.1 hypothetical protein [Candidatus Diapherotrites archaeon]
MNVIIEFVVVIYMELRYDKDADAVYIRLRDAPVSRSEELEEGIIVDYDDSGRVVGIEILNFSKRDIDARKLITEPSSVLPVAVV